MNSQSHKGIFPSFYTLTRNSSVASGSSLSHVAFHTQQTSTLKALIYHIISSQIRECHHRQLVRSYKNYAHPYQSITLTRSILQRMSHREMKLHILIQIQANRHPCSLLFAQCGIIEFMLPLEAKWMLLMQRPSFCCVINQS